jgi:exopolysaccharide biosynthesis polyprenyl glycosylphosphotransferase
MESERMVGRRSRVAALARMRPGNGRAAAVSTPLTEPPAAATQLTGVGRLRSAERPARLRAGKRRGWLVRRLLLLADVLGIMCGVAVAELAGISSTWYLLAPVFGVVLAKIYGLYDRDEERTHHTTVDDIVGVFHVVTVVAFVLLAVSTTYGTGIPVEDVIPFWAASIGFVITGRVLARALARRTVAYRQSTVIVGAGDIGQLIARKILQHPEYGIDLVGFVDKSPKSPRGDLGNLTILGQPDDLPQLVRDLDVERIVVAFSGESNEDTLALVRALRDYPIQIDVVPRLFEAVGPSTDIHAIEGLPLMGLPSVRITRTSRWMKRTLDVVLASTLLVLTAPMIGFIAYKVRRSSPGPVVFRQKRLGMNRRPFEMLKFRTMVVDTDAAVHREYIRQTMDAAAAPTENGLYKLDRGSAVTPFGAWLRKTSLDELLQLWNVVRGDMSLVGPRPCIAYETEFFEPHHFERFLVPQGITGLWQVEGRALMTPREALDLDVAYARGWSFGLDLSLLLRTAKQLVRPDRAI